MENGINAPKGVAGWLLLLCLGLTIFSPLLTAFNLWSTFEQTSSLFSEYPNYQTVYYTDLILSIILTILSIRAGLVLWNIKPNAVRIAKNYLLLFLGYTIIAAFLPFMSGFPESSNELMTAEVVKGTIKSIIYFTIWYSYLCVSKRVNATYMIYSNKQVLSGSSEIISEANEDRSESVLIQTNDENKEEML